MRRAIHADTIIRPEIAPETSEIEGDFNEFSPLCGFRQSFRPCTAKPRSRKRRLGGDHRVFMEIVRRFRKQSVLAYKVAIVLLFWDILSALARPSHGPRKTRGIPGTRGTDTAQAKELAVLGNRLRSVTVISVTGEVRRRGIMHGSKDSTPNNAPSRHTSWIGSEQSVSCNLEIGSPQPPGPYTVTVLHYSFHDFSHRSHTHP
eukprot:1393586-Rhodomonas_salina.1